MAIINLLDLQPHKVSRDIKDYSLMITGESGIGKTELAVDIYGRERTLVLAFEDSFKGISGIYGVNIDSYATLTAYLGQLENPAMREKFDTIIIDTLFLLDYMCEKNVTDAYGVDLVKDALKWNAGYKIIDKRFLEVIKRLQKMGYALCYIAHPASKKDTFMGKEIVRYEPKVSDRIKNLLMPEVDIRLFCYEQILEDGKSKRVIATQKSPFFDARCRVAEMAPLIDFDANIFREEFAKGIDKKEQNGGLIIDKEIKPEVKEWNFDDIMEYLTKDLATKAQEQGLIKEASQIIVKHLGRDEDSNPRTLAQATPQMLGALETIVVELEHLLETEMPKVA